MFHSYFNEYAFVLSKQILLTSSEEVLRLRKKSSDFGRSPPTSEEVLRLRKKSSDFGRSPPTSEEVLRLLCTLHRRKFRTNVSVHICNNLNVLYYRLF